jgi:hypothetical protein
VLDWEPVTRRALDELLAELMPTFPDVLIPGTGILATFVS